MKVALDTLGCKLNQAEAERLARQLTEAGHCLVESPEKADVYILNTCTVTHDADSKSRHLLRVAHRLNPGAMVIATGCYAERVKEELARIEGVSLVIGNDEKQHLAGLFPRHDGKAVPAGGQSEGRRTRALVKIQDGCRRFCAYCVVPSVRGDEKSESAADVVAEIKRRVSESYQEIVITGTDLSAYRDDGIGLKELLARVLAETDASRLRVSSLQPREISPDLLELWQDRRLCPHFHLSLQSGSDAVLKRMKRGYTVGDYRQAVSLIRAAVPDVAITTDVIVGFPGETEGEFAEGYELCRRLGFARIHVFPYSSRPGTEASGMPCQVSAEVKSQRARKMLALARESAENFHRHFLGRIMPVLWETEDDGTWSGFTANYIRVSAESARDLSNQVLPARLKETVRGGVRSALA